MRSAVVVFPGSNCDSDTWHAVDDVLKQPVEYVWHEETNLDQYDCIFIPGGFSYGDYLRSGAIAARSPVMQAVGRAAADGKWIVGICNGFQILTEAGLLPGALVHNDSLKFISDIAPLKVENHQTVFTRDYTPMETIHIPIAHGEGNYRVDDQTFDRLQKNGQIVFTYSGSNPNGSRNDIAGITNEAGNVLGMMPHPERAVHNWLGSTDGRALFTSLLSSWRRLQDDKGGLA
ncbi:MAG: phosphoribosylformylglycinamidine synthase [Bacilli bacterium]|nr:phosphoribosylformylglycinamidine synthase [Bacilli bacterium]